MLTHQVTGVVAVADAAVVAEGLRKRYGSLTAVDGVSFDVERGEIFGLLGPNGSGKTTTVECLQGLRRPDGGRLRVLGLDPVTHAAALRRRIGSQLQESALPDRMRVWEGLRLFASLVPGGADWEPLLDQWGLSGKRNATFASLSGGQRQRLFVALALVNRPELVFLDEMTTGLDPSARRVAWELIERIRDGGSTVVLVTHFMDEAARLCDRVGILAGGRLIALDTVGGLTTGTDGVRVKFSADGDLGFLRGLRHVLAVDRHGRQVEVRGEGPVLAVVAHALVERGIEPEDLGAATRSLEDVYLELTAPRQGAADDR